MSQQDDVLDQVETPTPYSDVMLTLYAAPTPLEEDELETVVDEYDAPDAKTTSYEDGTFEGAIETALHNRHIRELGGVRSDGESFVKYALTDRGEEVVEEELERAGVDPDQYRKEALKNESSGFGDLAPELGPHVGAAAKDAMNEEYNFRTEETVPGFETDTSEPSLPTAED